MKKRRIYLDFEIDKLTNSIENTISGDSFSTDVTLLFKNELKHITKSNGWIFDWHYEFVQNGSEIYKLTILNNPSIIQGLISLTIMSDHVFINLLESASFNRGKTKLYEGIAGNLVAYACKLSFENDYGGYVSFQAKTKLIDHYIRTLQARHFKGNRMIIETNSAKILIDKYYKL